MDGERIPWREVEPPPDVNGSLSQMLKTVDSLRSAWEEALQDASPEEQAEAQERRLRRHAIETGIIERLYDLDWGITEALVAEGLSSDVASREGGVSDDTLQTIRSQFNALQYLAELARNGRSGLSVMVIRQIHQIITRNQPTYEALNHLGQIVHPPLRHGEWKLQPNHVQRPDGTLLEYAPPEQVQPQLERLVELYKTDEGGHPIVRAAWLHHQFIRIHPFEDGNGRVARALTLLVLLRAHYAPLVVDRRQREAYIAALDAANDGLLGDLVRLFGQLEMAALTSTLTHPVAVTQERNARDVIHTYARRLQELKAASQAEKAEAVMVLARATHAMIAGHLDEQRQQLALSLREVDKTSMVAIFEASPPDERARWWRRQLIQAARSIDFYTNLSNGSWWTQLRLDALGERLRYLVAVQKVGHGETGVLAVTVHAELAHPESDEEVAIDPEAALELAPTDSVTLAYTDHAQERWPEIEELIRRTLRTATERFVERLG
jgi:Fic family protein